MNPMAKDITPLILYMRQGTVLAVAKDPTLLTIVRQREPSPVALTKPSGNIILSLFFCRIKKYLIGPIKLN
jgi:hypothetical protein